MSTAARVVCRDCGTGDVIAGRGQCRSCRNAAKRAARANASTVCPHCLRSAGGSHDDSNLKLAHFRCNWERGNAPLEGEAGGVELGDPLRGAGRQIRTDTPRGIGACA